MRHKVLREQLEGSTAKQKAALSLELTDTCAVLVKVQAKLVAEVQAGQEAAAASNELRRELTELQIWRNGADERLLQFEITQHQFIEKDQVQSNQLSALQHKLAEHTLNYAELLAEREQLVLQCADAAKKDCRLQQMIETEIELRGMCHIHADTCFKRVLVALDDIDCCGRCFGSSTGKVRTVD